MMSGNHPSQLSGQYQTDNARLILVLLLVTDLIFIVLHILRWHLNAPNIALRIDIDFSYGEVFQYTKFLWAAVLLGWFALRYRAWRFAAWSIVFLYFMADDCLGIHENVGGFIASRLDYEAAMGLQPPVLGELTVMILAAVALGILVFAAQLGAGKTVKRSFFELVGLIAILALFGLVVDMLHSMFEANPQLDFLLGTLEDGGEMVAASILVWYGFRLQNRFPVFSWRD